VRGCKQLADSDSAQYAQRLVNDKPLRNDLQSAWKHALAILRASRGRDGIDVVRGFGDPGLQRHASQLLGSLDRVVSRLESETKPTHRLRKALVAATAIAGAAGVTLAAKSAIGSR
jgi:hypothetical protein